MGKFYFIVGIFFSHKLVRVSYSMKIQSVYMSRRTKLYKCVIFLILLRLTVGITYYFMSVISKRKQSFCHNPVLN